MNASLPAYRSQTTNSYPSSFPFLDQLYSSVPGSEEAWVFSLESQVWSAEGERVGLKESWEGVGRGRSGRGRDVRSVG